MHKSLPRPEYFEAKIQLRPRNQEIEDFIIKSVAARPGVYITKADVIKTGIDFYITSQRYARSLGAILKRKFDGELTITRTIFGRHRQSSRVRYRGTVLFRVKEPEQPEA
ncbi:MAG TPA: NMD3-related protein [Candidatus Nanoarchaeia archaeon]|nr:NMD3-related protein [Candidatus Nanoarchaeia archaeon]